MDDQESVHRLKEGDISGFEILFTRYQRKALKTAVLITHDEQLAEDAVQESFVRIYQRISQFDETRPFAPYLMRIVVNAAIDVSEKSARWIHVESETSMETVVDLLFQAASTEEVAECTRLKQEIAYALKDLPPRQRAAIVQRYYLGMGEKEMAETLSTAPGTVKWLLSNARKNLRNLLNTERSLK